MKIGINIKEICITSLLIITLTLPSFIQFQHQLSENHDFISCHEQKAHIHENNLHCDSCEYHFSNFIYKVTTLPKLEVPPIISIIPFLKFPLNLIIEMGLGIRR